MKEHTYQDIGEFINIGYGSDIKIRDLAAQIKEIVGFEGAIQYDNSRPDGTPRKLLDISKLKSLDGRQGQVWNTNDV
jgi:GDP-L-fucose synthase